MKLIVVGILLLNSSANLVASESEGITTIYFKYDSNIFCDIKKLNLVVLFLHYILFNMVLENHWVGPTVFTWNVCNFVGCQCQRLETIVRNSIVACKQTCQECPDVHFLG